MVTPPSLKPGDVIRVIAPSGAFNRDLFDDGVSLLRERGFTVRVSDRIFERQRYLAGAVESRIVELNEAFAEPDTRAVWAARGGYGAGQLVSEMLLPSQVPDKWLVGFSDVTALHLRLQDHGVASLHGPNMTTLVGWKEEDREELFSILGGTCDQEFLGCAVHGADGEVTGPLFGGNLTVLTSLVGTGMVPSLKGAVVFLEDVGERPYRLDRSLNQLRLSGIFNEVAGFVLGQWKGCLSPDGSYSGLEVVVEELEAYGVPILSGVDVGHEAHSRPLLLGASATLDVAATVFKVRHGAPDGE